MAQNKVLVKHTDGQSQLLTIIDRLSSNTDVDPIKFKQIVKVFEHMSDKVAEQAYNASMVKAQAGMPIVPEDMVNTQTNSRYSSYKTILKYTKPVYTGFGFALSFYEGETTKENNIRVCADIMHEQGHTKTRHVDIPIDDKGIKGTVNKTRPHAKGSSLQYGKGYLIKMIFNIPTGDDDNGNAAGGKPVIKKITKKQIAEINKLQKEKFSGTEFAKRLEKKYKTSKLDDLISDDADSLIKSLNIIKPLVDPVKKEEIDGSI